MLVEILTVKAILMVSQTELRNMLLDSGKSSLCYKGAKNKAELCSCSGVL